MSRPKNRPDVFSPALFFTVFYLLLIQKTALSIPVKAYKIVHKEKGKAGLYMINFSTANQLNNAFSVIQGLSMQIIDQNGMILTDNTLAELGKYHPVAHKLMMSQDKSILCQIDTGGAEVVFQAVHVLEQDSLVVGAVSILGRSEEIGATAAAVALAMNGILKYEGSKRGFAQPFSKEDSFFKKLLGEESGSRTELENLAKELNYQPGLVRIPLLIKSLESDLDLKELIRQLKMCGMHQSQDIIIPLNERQILIFKKLGTDVDEGIGAYKSILYEYIAAVNKISVLLQAEHRFYVGSMQNSLDYYKYSYQHTLWLMNNTDLERGNAFLYYDYVQEYMESRIDFQEYAHVFQIYESLFEGEDREMFIHTVSSLFENNMNLAKTASNIFVHRNTLNFRLNKIKDILNIDPVNSNQSRELLRQLLHYYSGA